MILQTPGSFPIYIVKVTPGDEADPYLGSSEAAFDFEPTLKDVLEEIDAQERASRDLIISIRQPSSKESLLKISDDYRGSKFRDLCLKALRDLWPKRRKGKRLFSPHISRISLYDDAKPGKGKRKYPRHPRNLSIEKRYVKSKNT